MTVTNRPDLISKAVAHLVCEELPGVFVSPCERGPWEAFPPAPWSRFGWRPAMIIAKDGEPTVSVPFCPDLIAEQTNHLDEDDLRKYLTVLTFLMSHVAVKMKDKPTTDPDEIQQYVWAAENALDESNPDAMRFITQICAKAVS